MISAPVFLIASGVLSSGSTLMPPVQITRSAPASIAARHPSVIFWLSSSKVSWKMTSVSYSASFSRMTGVGASAQIAFTRSILSFLMTSGIILVPASLSPAFTGVFPWRLAIIISPKLFTFFNFSLSTFNSPLQSAMSSIFPSLTSDGCIWSFLHIS